MRICRAAATGVAFGWLLLTAPVALAQERPISSPQAEATPAPPVEKPGLFGSIGRWLDEGAARIRGQLRNAKAHADRLGDQAAADRRAFDKNAAQAAKAAAETVAKISVARPVDGHERCAVAPNGAPDCLDAAEKLCRKHGFASGKSLEFTSAEECPARTVLAGRRSGADCTTVTFISRAMCQ
jgi:hypothetical protein